MRIQRTVRAEKEWDAFCAQAVLIRWLFMASVNFVFAACDNKWWCQWWNFVDLVGCQLCRLPHILCVCLYVCGLAAMESFLEILHIGKTQKTKCLKNETCPNIEAWTKELYNRNCPGHRFFFSSYIKKDFSWHCVRPKCEEHNRRKLSS